MCYDCDCERFGHGRNKVCWTCRKFSNNQYATTCSRCNKKLQDITPIFRPPKHNDIKNWNKAKKRFQGVEGILG